MGDAKVLRLEDDTLGEYIVAVLPISGTRIAVSISEEIDVQGVAFALEHGVDAIVIPPEEMAPSLWLSAKMVAEEKISVEGEEIVSDISFATVSSVTTAGLGERYVWISPRDYRMEREFSLVPPHHAFVWFMERRSLHNTYHLDHSG